MSRRSGQWTEGIGLKVWKSFRLSINKYTESVVDDFVHRSQYLASEWEGRVRDVLSDPLPKKLWHRKRDPRRKFPHLNKGNQLDSISAGVSKKVTGAGNFAINAWAEVGTPYSAFTNLGYRKRADNVVPNWVGWLDDIFTGSRGFYSIEDVFDLLIIERGVLPRE